jgi:hypothetical protein
MANSMLSADPELDFIVRASDPGNASVDASRVTDWQRAIALAVAHRVYPRVAEHAAPCFPNELRHELHDLVQTNARAALRNLMRTREVAALLHSSGIETIVLKGPLLARELYGDFALRAAGDVDILVRDADLLRACQLLDTHGYTHHTPISERSLARHRRRQHDVSFAHPADNSLIELHADVAQPHYGYRFDLGEWWSSRRPVPVGDAELWTLGPEHGYLMAAIHAAKHRWERLDLICDLAVYRRRELDWGKVYMTAADAWMLSAIRTGEEVAAAFFEEGNQMSHATQMVVEKVVAGEQFGRLAGAALDLRLRERTSDRARYLWRRALSASSKV